MIAVVRWINFLCLGVDLVGLGAHVLELPNKLRLDGRLWVAVQQELYRGWGPWLGPFEVGAVVSAWVLVLLVRGRRSTLPTVVAAVCLTVMFSVFFAVVQPVNAAFAGWRPDALPPDWASYRLRWEFGHAGRALLGAIALGLLIVAARADRRPRTDAPTARA